MVVLIIVLLHRWIRLVRRQARIAFSGAAPSATAPRMCGRRLAIAIRPAPTTAALGFDF